MLTHSTVCSGVMMTAAVTVTAMLQIGTAAADPSQDDQFLAVLQTKQIPAMDNVPTVVAAGHTVCRKLDDGVPVDAILDGLRNDAYQMNPRLRLQAARLSATMGRFITAAVEVYCPGAQGKIASIVVSRARQTSGPTRVFTVATYHTNSTSGDNATDDPGVHTVLSSSVGPMATGDIVQPNPPQVPAPKRPEGKIPRVPQVGTVPPPPRQPPPPPQQIEPPPPQAPPPPPEQIEPPPPQAPPPPPEQIEPPPPQAPPEQIEPSAGGPQSGKSADGTGSGNGGGSGNGSGTGDGGNGGGGAGNDGSGPGSPAGPPQPAQPRPPGMIRLVPW